MSQDEGTKTSAGQKSEREDPVLTDSRPDESNANQVDNQKATKHTINWERVATISDLVFSGVVTITAVLGLGYVSDQISVSQNANQIASASLAFSRKQAEDGAADTERALKASEESAAAAAKAVEIMRATTRLEQRAWVGMTALRVSNFAVGKVGEVTAEMKNSGHTPALNVRGRLLLSECRSMGEIGKLDLVDYRSISVLQPESTNELALKTGQPLKDDEIAKITDGREVVCAYGKFSYDDVFGCPHQGTFCGYLDKITDPLMKSCSHDNDIDRNLCEGAIIRGK